MKPNLACDAKLDKLKYPVVVLPKIDGVRGWNPDGELLGRSLKKFRNQYVSTMFTHQHLAGLDGELALGSPTVLPVSPSLCRDTTSAVTSGDGCPEVTWWVFDLVDETTEGCGYADRLETAMARVRWVRNAVGKLNIAVVPATMCFSLEEVLELEAKYLDEGYEGIIIRDPNGLHKQGRSTVKEGGFLRIKRFADAEACVLSVVEGLHNGNEAKTNELGHTERSSHAENMVPNGTVGMLVCRDLESGRVINVGPGAMAHAERKAYFDSGELIGKIIKYKFFPHGEKDKPRFPTFLSIRSPEDM